MKKILTIVVLYFFIGILFAIKWNFFDIKPAATLVWGIAGKVMFFIEDIAFWPMRF